MKRARGRLLGGEAGAAADVSAHAIALVRQAKAHSSSQRRVSRYPHRRPASGPADDRPTASATSTEVLPKWPSKRFTVKRGAVSARQTGAGGSLDVRVRLGGTAPRRTAHAGPADHACAAALRPPGPCPMSPQQPQLARFADGAHARIDRQLALHVLHMAFHRVARQDQRIGDLAVAHAVGHQAQDLLFARAQRFFQRRRCLCRAGRWRGAGRLQLGNDAPRDERVDGGAAAQHAADGDAHPKSSRSFST